MAFQHEPLDAVEHVVRVCGVVVAPCDDLMGQFEGLFPVVFVVLPIVGDGHFGVGVHALLGCSGRQFPQVADVAVERIRFFGIGGVLRQDGHGGHGHGVGVADGGGFAEKLDRIGQVEVRVFVEVFQVEQQRHSLPGIGRLRERLLEAVRQLLVCRCVQACAPQDTEGEEYFPEVTHFQGWPDRSFW